jgi:predicted RNA polymerase sigma factor
VLPATVHVTRDIDAAEEAVRNAYVQALRTWARDGVPERPGAWLTTVARRTALNAIRRGEMLQTKLPLLVVPDDTDMVGPGRDVDGDHDTIPDDRLRLIFTCCHPALAEPAQVALTLRLVRDDLTGRALDLARLLRRLLPADREAAGLLALLLVHDARRATRTDAGGRLLRLEQQDRTAWDREQIAEAERLVVAALSAGPLGRFTLQAVIAALHAQAPSYPETDCPQILTLYDELLRSWPSPVVALNRAGRGLDGPRPRGGAGGDRGARTGGPPVRLSLPTLDQGRPPEATRPPRRGRRRVPGGAGAQRQRRRAGVPGRARQIVATGHLMRCRDRRYVAPGCVRDPFGDPCDQPKNTDATS